MKKAVVIFLILLGAAMTQAQSVTIQGGMLRSNFEYIGNDIYFCSSPKFDKPLWSAFIYAGLHYLEKEHFEFSSNVGLLRKTSSPMNNYYNVEDLALNYLSFNSIFYAKYTFVNKITLFADLGPRADILIFKKNNELFGGSYSNIIYGAMAGAGVRYSFTKLKLAVSYDRYFDFNKTNYNRSYEVWWKGSSLNLTVGYSLK